MPFWGHTVPRVRHHPRVAGRLVLPEVSVAAMRTEDHQTRPGWPVISVSWSPLQVRATSARVPIRRSPRHSRRQPPPGWPNRGVAAGTDTCHRQVEKVACHYLMERPSLRLKDRFEVNRSANLPWSPRSGLVRALPRAESVHAHPIFRISLPPFWQWTDRRREPPVRGLRRSRGRLRGRRTCHALRGCRTSF